MFPWFLMRDTGTGIQVVAPSVAMGSPWTVKWGAELVPRSPGRSHLLMALLHEDELFPHSLHLLFQVCRDDGQIIQGLPEALNFNFQVLLERVFIFIPLARGGLSTSVMEGHGLCWSPLGLRALLLFRCEREADRYTRDIISTTIRWLIQDVYRDTEHLFHAMLVCVGDSMLTFKYGTKENTRRPNLSPSSKWEYAQTYTYHLAPLPWVNIKNCMFDHLDSLLKMFFFFNGSWLLIYFWHRSCYVAQDALKLNI